MQKSRRERELQGRCVEEREVVEEAEKISKPEKRRGEKTDWK